MAIYENPECGCRWLQIHQPCRPNAGFSQCEQFGKGNVTYHPDEYQSPQCPVHGLYGWYDRNYVRESFALGMMAREDMVIYRPCSFDLHTHGANQRYHRHDCEGEE